MDLPVFVAHWIGEPIEMMQVGGIATLAYLIGVSTAHVVKGAFGRKRQQQR